MQHPAPPPPNPARLRGWQRAALWLLGLGVLGLVFMLYTQPAFMVQMADHVWGCF